LRIVDSERESQAPKEEPKVAGASLREVAVWTFAPCLILVALGGVAVQFTRDHLLNQWLASFGLLAALVAQCYAFAKSRQIGKERPRWQREVGTLMALVSVVLLFFWIGWTAISFYYAANPGAPMLFGGS
jgi:uncharacterized membrane protein YfcA